MARTKKIVDKWHIGAPMSGYEDLNIPAITAATLSLRNQGYTVIDPVEAAGADLDQPWTYYMQKDLDLLAGCTHMAVLHGWQDPEAVGVRLEIATAIARGIQVWQYDSEYGVLDYPLTDLVSDERELAGRILSGDDFGYYDEDAEQIDALQEAYGLVHGERSSYDHPINNFGRIVRLWNALLFDKLKEPITEEEHAMMMMQVKQARLLADPGHRDSFVDIAGYAGTYEMIRDVRDQEEADEQAGYDLLAFLNALSEGMYTPAEASALEE